MPDVFWRNTWAENALMSEAYQTKENKEWERTRLLVSMIHNVNCTKRAQMIKPKDVIELPIDKIKRKKLIYLTSIKGRIYSNTGIRKFIYPSRNGNIKIRSLLSGTIKTDPTIERIISK